MKHRTLRVNWADIVDPCGYEYTIAQEFELLRYLHSIAPKGDLVTRMIARKSSVINVGAESEVGGPDWRSQLQEAFRLIVCGRTHAADLNAWRHRHGVVYGQEHVYPVCHAPQNPKVRPNRPCVYDMLRDLLNLTGTFRSKHGPNEYHPKARQVHTGRIVTWKGGHRIEADYGYEDEGGWWFDVARQEKDELFDDFMERAWRAAKAVIDRDNGWTYDPAGLEKRP